MRRVLFVFVILVTVVIFPDRSWLCQPANTPIPAVTNPCGDPLNMQLATVAGGVTVFSLLTPTRVAVHLNERVSSLAYPPLLTPEELVQPQIDPPPRSCSFLLFSLT